MEKNKEQKQEEVLAIKEIPDKTVINVTGIAEATREFKKDKETHKINVFVLKAKINSENVFIRVNEGTSVFRQIQNFISDNDLELPLKICDYSWTIEKALNQNKQEYILFKELKESNYSSLFD